MDSLRIPAEWLDLLSSSPAREHLRQLLLKTILLFLFLWVTLMCRYWMFLGLLFFLASIKDVYHSE